MPTPIEHDSVSQSYLADSEQDGFGLGARDDDDALYNEITERRAQLERADILARARAL
jgi:hypothetical protein